MKIIQRLSSIFFLILLLTFFPVSVHANDLTKSWSATTNLPYSLASHVAFGNGMKAFILDGSAQTGNSHNQIISAISGVNGGLSSWSVEASFPTALIFHAIARKDNNIYILGGREENPGSAMDHVNKVFVANMNSLSSWGQTSPLPSNRSLGAAVISGDYIYFSGGFNSTGYTNKVYAAHIRSDGMLDPWFEVSPLPLSRIGHGMVEDNGYLYVLGGDHASQIYRATVNPGNGTISPWSQISVLPEMLYRSAVIKIGKQIYMIGGHNGVSTINKIYYTTINSDGSLEPWQLSVNTLPLPVQAGAVAQVGKYLYLTGGFRSPPGIYLNSVYKTELNISVDPDLDVPLFKQNDPAWGFQIYDTANLWSPNKTGIDRWGCAMTSAAMVFNYHKITKLPDGQNLDPGTLNSWLKSQPDGYVGEGLVNWNALSRLSKLSKSQNPEFTYHALENYRVGGFAKTQLEQDLENDIPGILEVPNHFVVGKGIDGDSVIIHDPFYARTDLTEYGDTFKSLRRFVPSNTDLSSVLLIAREGTEISMIDKNGNIIGEGYVQEPIHDDVGGGQTPKTYIIYEVKKPNSGNYSIKITARGTNQYELKQYLYDADGNVKVLSVLGIVDEGQTDEFYLSYDKEQINNSGVSQNISYESVLLDLELLYKEGQISNIGIYTTLKQNTLVSKQLIEISKPAAIAHLKTVLRLLTNQKGKFVSEDAYHILTPQVEYLLSTL